MTKRTHREISDNDFLAGVAKGCTVFLWLVILGIAAVCAIIFVLFELRGFPQ